MVPTLEHSAYIGTTRYGKSEKCLSVNAPRMKKTAMVWIDPHGTLVEKAAIWAIHNGMGHRLIYDEVYKTAGVPGYPFLTPSTDPDSEIRLAENRERAEEAKAIILRGEGKLDAEGSPIINEGLEAALRLFINQRSPVPFYWLRDCFTKESDAYKYLIANCTDPQTTWEFLRYEGMNAKDWDYNCGPAYRRLKRICESIHFQKRCTANFDLAEFLNRKGILMLNGASKGGLSRPDASRIMGMVILNVIHLARSGKIKRVILVVDEGVNASLLDMNIGRALAEAAKWGLEIVLIIQNPLSFPNPFIGESIFQNCSTQYFFRQVNPKATEFAADMIGTCQLDPNLVRRVIERIRLVDDGYDTIETSTDSELVDEHGNKRKGKTKGQTFRARPKREEIETYEELYSLDDQIKLYRKTITNLHVGQFMIRSGGYTSARPEYSEMLKMPYNRSDGAPHVCDDGRTLGQTKLDIFLEQARSERAEYQTCAIRMPPCKPKKRKGME